MTWLAVKALLAPIPRAVWLVLLALALVAAGCWGLVHLGAQRGAQRVTRAARADTTRRAIAAVDTATQATDRSIARAVAQRTRSDVGRAETRRAAAEVAQLRNSATVVAALDSTPAPVLKLVTAQAEQLARDSLQIARDSITIAVHVAALDSAQHERLARVALDTARVHERNDKPPDDGIGVQEVAAGVGVATVVVAVVRGVLHLLHR